MDQFGNDEYQALLKVQQGPAVSIYFPAQRLDNKGKNNQLAFRAQVRLARALLAERYEPQEYRDIDIMMDARLEDGEFWGSLTQGVAAFFAPGFERVYRLNQDVLAETVVGETLHTRPMLRVLARPQHYWVLALDAKDTRLYEVNGRQIDQVGIGVIPTSVESALFQPYPPQQQDRQREVTSPPGGNAGVHGVGDGRDGRPELLRQFAQVVDARLKEFLRGDKDPLILGAAGQIKALFRQESTLSNLFSEGLQESLSHLTTAEIRERSQPIIHRFAEHKVDDILALWEREYGRGQGEIDLQQIATRTLMSQVRYLFIERGRRIWGSLNRNNGTISISGENGQNHQDMQSGRSDILDELAEFVISRGGEAFVLEPEKMPSETGAAAILRGSGPVIIPEPPRPQIN